MADDKPKAVRGPGGKFLKKTAAPPAEAFKTYDGKDELTSASAPSFAPGSFVWAADHIVNGRTVRRTSWIGNKSIGLADPTRNILENEDFLANDWVLV